MPKRKSSRTREEDLKRLKRKLKRLEEKIQEKTRTPSPLLPAGDGGMARSPATPTVIDQNDWLTQPGLGEEEVSPIVTDEQNIVTDEQNIVTAGSTTSASPIPPAAVTAPATVTSADPAVDVMQVDLGEDILAILGDDPTETIRHGPDVRKELSSRLQHIATEGLSKEARKEVVARYPTPANCLCIDAPKLNLEIKAAIPENIAKRDKGIESKQKQLASAISCLAEIITMQLNSKERNNETLQKLMEATRILCDIQHSDSVTRRNFILFGLKKDMNEHLTNTKIDTFLFGEGLAETLRSAKAVNRSSVELKAGPSMNKIAANRPKPVQRGLNRRAPPARRQPGPPPPQARSREPAQRAQPRFPPPPAYYSRTSSQPHPTPLPPPPAMRRRY